jgi:hypothetical protein
MFASVMLSALPVLLAPFLIAPQSASQCGFDRLGHPVREEQVLTAFGATVDRYVDLHRRLERHFPPEQLLSDPEQTEIATLALADAIRGARPNAVPGNIFTAEVAHVFRLRIMNNLRNGHDLATLVSSMDEEGWIEPKPVAVNQPFPWGVPNFIWPSILRTLPQLPAELEYRFVDRDLVLLDVHANLVVDILELALPAL